MFDESVCSQTSQSLQRSEVSWLELVNGTASLFPRVLKYNRTMAGLLLRRPHSKWSQRGGPGSLRPQTRVNKQKRVQESPRTARCNGRLRGGWSRHIVSPGIHTAVCLERSARRNLAVIVVLYYHVLLGNTAFSFCLPITSLLLLTNSTINTGSIAAALLLQFSCPLLFCQHISLHSDYKSFILLRDCWSSAFSDPKWTMLMHYCSSHCWDK